MSILRNHEVVSTPTTVDKALNPLNLMADRPGLTLNELNRKAAFPLPTQRLVRTLADHGLCRHDCSQLADRYCEGA